MRGTMMEGPLLVPALLDRPASYFPDVEVVSRQPDKSVHRTNWREVHRRSRALAESLSRLGLRKGDRVATLMWNHARHLETYFAVPLLGGITHTLNLRLHPDDLASIATHADDRFPVVPMFHVDAWGLPFAAPMVGAKLVFPGPHLDPHSLLQLMESEKVTIGAGVPTIWMGILDALDKEPQRYKLQKDVRMVVGGSAAPEALIRGFDRHGLHLLHAWGMTEMSPIGSCATIKAKMQDWDYDAKVAVRAKQGLAVPLVDVRAVDESGREVPWDGKTQGELQVRGPAVASSYTDMEGSTDRWTRDGWFKTGDVVTIDREGYLQITDRTKDLIKSGGEWISSVALENELMGHPAVKEAAVVAVPHPKWSERPLAAIVLREGAKTTPEELRDYLLARVAKFSVPDAFVFLDAIPP